MTTKHMQLWAWRHSVGYGWRWYPERGVTSDTAAAWLAQYQKDEPHTHFKAQISQPRTTPAENSKP